MLENSTPAIIETLPYASPVQTLTVSASKTSPTTDEIDHISLVCVFAFLALFAILGPH